QRRGHGAVVAREFIDEAVELGGGDAWLDHGRDEIERLGGEGAGLAHAFKAFLAMQRDDAGHALLLGRRFDVGGHWILRSWSKGNRLIPRREGAGRERCVRW